MSELDVITRALEEIAMEVAILRDSDSHVCANDTYGCGDCTCEKYDAVIDLTNDLKDSVESGKLQLLLDLGGA